MNTPQPAPSTSAVPKPPADTGALLDSILTSADVHFAREDWTAARDALSLAVELAPNQTQIRAALGSLQYQLQEYPAACASFTIATKQSPDNPDLHTQLAMVHIALQQEDAAKAALQQAVNLRPDHLAAQQLLGGFDFAAKRYAVAAQHYCAAVRGNPNDLNLLLHLGKCLYELRDLASAHWCFKRVIAVEPSNAIAADALRIISGVSKTNPSQLTIDVYTVAHNEEKMVKYFIEHYLPIARYIHVLDHESTDNMVEVCKSYGDKVRVIPVHFTEQSKFSNIQLSEIKARFAAQSDADFVIASDTDDLIFPRDPRSILIECLANGITVPLTTGYHMLSDAFDFQSDIYDIKRAYKEPRWDKKIVFCPKIKIGWDVGQHCTAPELCGNGYKESESSLLELRHYKYINMNYVISRNKVVGDRIDRDELKMGMGFHHVAPEVQQRQRFENMLSESILLQ